MLGMNVPEKSALWLDEKTQLAYKIQVKNNNIQTLSQKKDIISIDWLIGSH